MDKTRFAIVTFAANASVRIPFSGVDYQTQKKLSKELQQIKKDKLGNPTRTDRALELAGREVFVESNWDRPDAQGVLVVLTDGKTHTDSKAFDEVLKPIKVLIRIKLDLRLDYKTYYNSSS